MHSIESFSIVNDNFMLSKIFQEHMLLTYTIIEIYVMIGEGDILQNINGFCGPLK